MDDRGIEQKIAALSEGLVLLEPSDPRGLADLHTGFEEIGNWADGVKWRQRPRRRRS